MAIIPPARPRVLLIHNFLSPYRVPLFTELARRFELDLWILGDVSRLREWQGDAPADAFPYRVLPHLGMGLGSRYNMILVNPTLPLELARHRYDALICCGWDTPAVFYAACWARLRRIPFVLWAGSTPAERTWVRRLTTWPVRRLVRAADAWIAYGTRARDYLVELGADQQHTYRAFNTIETDAFARNSALSAEQRRAFKKITGIPAENDVVLFCGNLLALKGLDDLLPGFARFAENRQGVTLLLVGSGKDETRYRTMAARLGIEDRVVFAGYVARNELAPYYAIADLLVLPSYSEVWGLVVNEAMACGVPVLVSEAVGASTDLVREGVNGYVAPVGSPERIAELLARYFDAETDRQAMAAAARETIAPYTIGAMAEAFEAAVATARGRRP